MSAFAESDGTVTVPLTLSGTGTLAAPVTITATVQGSSTATEGATADFTAVLSAIFPAGTNLTTNPTQNLAILLNDDAVVESNETIVLGNLVAIVSGGDVVSIGATNTHTLTINDNDATTVSIAANDAAASETAGNNGQFTVTLDGGKIAPPAGIIVNYSIAGTAANTTDYAPLSGSVLIAGGASSATIDVLAVDDRRVEGNETVNLTLTGTNNPSVTVGATAAAAVNIGDNDAATVSFAAATSTETENFATLPRTVQINFATTGVGTEGLDQTVSVNVSAGGTANANNFAFTPVGLNFVGNAPLAQNVNVSLFDNLLNDDGLNIVLSLGGLVDGTGGQVTIGATPAHTINITDDDDANARRVDLPVAGDYTIARNGGNLEFSGPVTTLAAPFGNYSVTVNGSAGIDSLTVNLASGDAIPDGGITFNGAAPAVDPGDELIISGGAQGAVAYTSTNASDGSIDMSNFGTVNYTGLEPITNTGTAADIIFNLPAVANDAVLEDDGTLGNNMSRLRSASATFELTNFTNPMNSLTINRGTAADTLIVSPALNPLDDFHAGLTVGTAALPFATISVVTPITLNAGTAALDLAAAAITLGANVTTTNAQTYQGDVTLADDVTLTASTVTFNGQVIGGGNSLDIVGNAVFGDAATDTVTGLDTLSVSGTTLINTNTVTSTGTQTYQGNVTLGTDVTITASTATFNGQVIGGGNTLAITGNAVFGNAATDTVTGLDTLSVSGTTAINTSTVTSTGTQTYQGNVTLGADVTITASTVTFNGQVIGGGNSLDISGNAVFGNAAADTVTGLDTLSVSGTTAINTSTVTSTGTQTYQGNVTLGTDVTITASTVTFNGQVIGGGNSLDISGNAVFGNAATDTVTGLDTLTVNGTTAINTNTVTSTGTQTYQGNVTLGTDVTITASTVAFNGQVIGGGNTLAITGNAVFGDAATDTVTGLDTLSVSGTTTINTNTVTSTGTQTYTGPVTIGALAGTATLTTTNSAVLFGSTTTLNSNLTVNAGSGAITFTGAVNGGFALTANSTGATTFTAAVGNVTSLASVTTNPGGTTAINGGVVTTTGNQTYNDNVTIGAAAILSTTNSAVLFGGTTTLNGNLTVNAGSGPITFTGAVDGGFALAANSTGATTFTSAVGAGTSLASVTTNAGGTTAINGASVTTTGDQAYDDSVAVNSSVANLTTLTAQDITIGATGSLNGAVAGESVRMVTTATITFNGPVGNTQPLDALTLEAGAAVTQTAPIAGNGLELLLAGPFTLNHPSNEFAVLAGLTTGAVQYTDASALTIGAVNSTTGLSAASIAVTTGGPLTVAANVTAGTTINLTATESPAANNNVVVQFGVTVDSGAATEINAGDNVTIDATATLDAATTLTMRIDVGNGDPAVGQSLTIANSAILITAAGAFLVGNSDNDTFQFPTQADSTIDVKAGVGNDSITVVNQKLDGVGDLVTIDGEADGDATNPTQTANIRRGGTTTINQVNKKRPFFLPTPVSVSIADQVFWDDTDATNPLTPASPRDADYSIKATDPLTPEGSLIRNGASLLSFKNVEQLELTSAAGNDDIIADQTVGPLPNVVRIKDSGGPDNRFQVEGSNVAEAISIGDIGVENQIWAAIGRAGFELAGIKRLWIRGNGGNDTIDNISRVPGLLEGGIGADLINSIVNVSSQFVVSKIIANSAINNVTLVLGNEGADRMFTGSGAADIATPPGSVAAALKAFPDKGITFLIGDYKPNAMLNKLVKIGAGQPGDRYASSANKFQHGFVSLKDTASTLGIFKFGAGDSVKFSSTIAWLKAQIFIKAALDQLVNGPLSKQLAKYTKVVGPSGLPIMAAAVAEGETILFVDPAAGLQAKYDVNRDNAISPADALVIINEINARGSHPLPPVTDAEGEDASEGAELKPVMDVNGDSYLSPIDALLVINMLNSLTASGAAQASSMAADSTPTSEDSTVEIAPPSAKAAPSSTAAANDDALLALLSSEWQDEQRRREELAAALI